MKPSLADDKEFLERLTELILSNLGDEKFGGKELAQLSGITRTEINRKLHAAKNIYINEFIREVRLGKALDILQNEELTVSEVAYKVGFSSPSYFNKCFHELFGYPPGKVEKVHEKSTEVVIAAPVAVNRAPGEFLPRFQSLTRSGILLLSLFIVVGAILIYPKIFKHETLDNLRSSDGKISVAVMPFRNLTNDTTWKIWQDGIQISLISSLSNSKELRVTDSESVLRLIQREGFTDYASMTPSVAGKISKEFDAKVFICGSIIKAGEKIRVNTQIISTDRKEVLQSFETEGPEKGEMIFKNLDSMRQEVKNFLKVSFLKNSDLKTTTYYLDPIRSPEAYSYMVSARKAERNSDFSTAIDMYSEAIRIDSTIYDAYAFIAICYGEQGNWKNCKEWLLIYYSNYDKLNMYNKLFADYLNAIVLGTPYEAIRYVRQMIEHNDKVPYNFINLGDEYNKLFQYDRAIPEYERAFEIYKKWKIKPGYLINYTELGKAYHITGRYRKEKRLYKTAERDFHDSPGLLARKAILSLSEKDTVSANQYIREYKRLQINSWSEAKISNGIAVIYSQGGQSGMAESYYRKARALEPQNTLWMNNLGFFLIDKERNVEEGLNLIDMALALDRDNYLLLDSKGWGLFKKGRYNEAFDIIQRGWELRLQNARYDHAAYQRLEEVKRVVAGRNG